MSKYARITNGQVDLVVEQSDVPAIEGQWVDGTTQLVGPGFLFDGTTFTKPVVTEVRYITQLAFLNRFTDAEAIAIDLASIGATVQAASMRRYKEKVNAANFIDLDRGETRAGVQALEAVGLLGTGRALEILDAPVQDSERPL